MATLEEEAAARVAREFAELRRKPSDEEKGIALLRIARQMSTERLRFNVTAAHYGQNVTFLYNADGLRVVAEFPVDRARFARSEYNIRGEMLDATQQLRSSDAYPFIQDITSLPPDAFPTIVAPPYAAQFKIVFVATPPGTNDSRFVTIIPCLCATLHTAINARIYWSPWPEGLSVPTPDYANLSKKKVLVHGKWHDQPRGVRGYGRDYVYSKKPIRAEPTTPDAVQALIDYTNKLAPTARLNMCLENTYSTGNQAIGAHKDDEVDLAKPVMVYAFVVGEAARNLIFTHVQDSTYKFQIGIPAGFYAMLGDEFQTQFTHQMPKISLTGLAKVLKQLEHDLNEMRILRPTETSEIADLEALYGALNAKPFGIDESLIVRAHANRLREAYRFAHDAKSVARLDEWLKPRASYTLRRIVGNAPSHTATRATRPRMDAIDLMETE